ncbi:uracil permease [Salmonella enterica subsp. enterica]|nr:uracil permease [Salmonella enterica subsp. enterica]
MFPPAAMGAIVAVIGLELAGVAAGMAGLLPAQGQSPDTKTIIISMVTLAVTVFGSVLFRGFLAIIPILIGVLAGYALSFALGVVDTTPIAQAHWFALPTFYTPRFEWFAILTILPAALVVIAEHVGHLVVTANIVKKDLVRDPGLHRSMFANGLSTIVSGFFGSTPNTTYGGKYWRHGDHPAFTVPGLSAARRFLPFCFPASANWRRRFRLSRYP